MIKDIYNSKRTFDSWKQDAEKYGIEGLNKTNSKWLLLCVTQLENGENTAKGKYKGKQRSYLRLNTIRNKLGFMFSEFENRGIKDVSKQTETELKEFFKDIKNGSIKKKNGEPYESADDFIKDIGCFWNWLVRYKAEHGEVIENITKELNKEKKEPDFVYFTKEELDEMLPYFTEDEQVRMLFMFDTLIRTGKELSNVKVSDIEFSADPELHIRKETTKTYERRIKLLLCSDTLKKYIKRNKLQPDDFLFEFSPAYFNRKLQKVASQIWGNSKESKGGAKFCKISAYDFRHSGAIFWRLGAYRGKIDSLMYRGGWNDLAILNYYTRKIGMKDSIEKEDLLVTVDKNKLEQQIEELQKDSEAQAKEFLMMVDDLTKKLEAYQKQRTVKSRV